LQYSGVSIFYFAEGKIEQVWSSFDELGLHNQLGLLSA
jgi:predicted ester cyclase